MGKARSYAIRGFWLGAALLAGLSGPVAAAELSAEQTIELERLLYRLNFDPGEIDGVVDERTRTAIRLYQEFAALSPDGEPSPALLAEMRAVAQAFDEMKAAQAAEQAAQEAELAAQAVARAAEEEKARAAAEQAAQEAAEQAARAAEEEKAQAAEQAARAAAAQVAEEEQARAAQQAAREKAQAAEQAARAAEEEQARAVEQAARAAEQAAQEKAQAAEHAAQAAAAAPEPEPSKVQVASAPAPVPAATPPPAPTRVASTTAPANPAPSVPPAQARPEFDLEGVISRLVKRAGPAPSQAAPARPKARTAAVARAGRIPLGLARKAPLPRTGARLAKKFPPNTLADSLGYVNLKKGYAAAQSGNPRRAIELYTRAIEAEDLKLDHLAGAYYNRANAHHYNGTLNFAIQDYSAAILNKSDFPDAYYNRGLAFEANGQHTRAVADFMTARALGLQLLGVRSPDLPPPRP